MQNSSNVLQIINMSLTSLLPFPGNEVEIKKDHCQLLKTLLFNEYCCLLFFFFLKFVVVVCLMDIHEILIVTQFFFSLLFPICYSFPYLFS